MNREISVTYTPRLVRLTLYYQFRTLLLYALAGMVFVGISAVYLFSKGNPAGSSWSSLWPALIFPAVLGLIFYNGYSSSMATIRKMKSPVIQYVIKDDGLEFSSDLATGTASWDAYKTLRKNGKLWSLISQAGGAVVFPVESIDSELAAFLTAKFPKAQRSWFQRFKFVLLWLAIVVVMLLFFVRQSLSPHLAEVPLPHFSSEK